MCQGPELSWSSGDTGTQRETGTQTPKRRLERSGVGGEEAGTSRTFKSVAKRLPLFERPREGTAEHEARERLLCRLPLC